MNVSGVGANKLKKYGQRFLEEIQKFCTERPGVTLSMTEEGEEWRNMRKTEVYRVLRQDIMLFLQKFTEHWTVNQKIAAVPEN